jgi:toxin ParE1/3/4
VKPIVFDRRARRELDKAMAWYEKKRAGLGLDFHGEVQKTLDRIEQNPALGSPYKQTDFRFRFVRRFAYVVYYLELDDSIWIAALAHASRRPGYWRRRRKK